MTGYDMARVGAAHFDGRVGRGRRWRWLSRRRRLELGTLPYELLAGTTTATGFLADLAPTESGVDRLLAAL
ncbi:hypothetical protein ACOBQX_11995 [Actinokineospora sp. G85]|uniref:hypothetical protein n=1 Tax=Actinokineospora sp. G85 TaxID=3406626 RepID=UPI003C746F73